MLVSRSKWRGYGDFHSPALLWWQGELAGTDYKPFLLLTLNVNLELRYPV